jgi:hypothetical protein
LPGAAGAFTIDLPKLSPEDEKRLMQATRDKMVRE